MLTVKKVDYGVIYFGVHRHKKWNDLPIDYLEWLLTDECNTSKENKETAYKVLKQKRDHEGQGLLFESN